MLEHSLDKIIQVLLLTTGIVTFIKGLFTALYKHSRGFVDTSGKDIRTNFDTYVVVGEEAVKGGIGLMILAIIELCFSYFYCHIGLLSEAFFSECTIYSEKSLEVEVLFPVIIFIVVVLFFIVSDKESEIL